MSKLGKLINDKDNVMTALADVTTGEEVKLRSKGRNHIQMQSGCSVRP
jgi:hypothetical protein